MSRVVALPRVNRYEVPTSGSYKLTPYKVKKKFLQKCYNKIFDFLVARGYITEKSIMHVEIQMEKVEIQLDRLDEQISKNKDAIQMVYDNRVDTIIVGADIMRQIMNGDPYRMGQINLQMNGESKFARFSRMGADMRPIYEHVQYRGLNIILVPWFEGFLILEAPKNEDYRNYTTNRENFRFEGFEQ